MEFKHLVFTITAFLVIVAGALAMTQGESLESFLEQDDNPGLTAITGKVVMDHLGEPIPDHVLKGLPDPVLAEGETSPSPQASRLGFTEIGKLVMYLLVLFFLVSGVFGLAKVSSRLDEQQDSRRAVVQYIKLAKKQGFKKDKIRKRLEENGWGEQDLGRGFDKVL